MEEKDLFVNDKAMPVGLFPHLKVNREAVNSSFLKNLIKRGDEDSYLFDGRLPALQQSKGIVCRQR